MRGIVKINRQRQSQHRPHGQVHERGAGTDRDNQPDKNLMRFGILVPCKRVLRSSLGSSRLLSGPGSRSVSRLPYCAANCIVSRAARIKLHNHGVLQQIDGNGIDSRNGTDGLFHAGRAGRAAHPRHIELVLDQSHLEDSSSFLERFDFRVYNPKSNNFLI